MLNTEIHRPFTVTRGTLSAGRAGSLAGETQYSNENVDVFVRGQNFRVVSRQTAQELRALVQDKSLCIQAGQGPDLTEVSFPLQFLTTQESRPCGSARWISGSADEKRCQLDLHRNGEVSIYTVRRDGGLTWHKPID